MLGINQTLNVSRVDEWLQNRFAERLLNQLERITVLNSVHAIDQRVLKVMT